VDRKTRKVCVACTKVIETRWWYWE